MRKALFIFIFLMLSKSCFAQDFVIKLTEQEVHLTLFALSKQPYEISAGLIKNIQEQATQQAQTTKGGSVREISDSGNEN